MLATESPVHFQQYGPTRMSDASDWTLQCAYFMQALQKDNEAHARRLHGYQVKALNARRLSSLDFFDFSTRSGSAMAQLSRPTGVDYSTIPDSASSDHTTSEHSHVHHVRSLSGSQCSAESVEEDNEDEQHTQRQDSWHWDRRRSSITDGAIAKRKMKRFRLTHKQTRFLMNEFVKQAHPDAEHREHLSKEIPGLSPRQVQVWFQNRRAKLKRLSVDDRDRMLTSRTLPETLDQATFTQLEVQNRETQPLDSSLPAAIPSSLTAMGNIHEASAMKPCRTGTGAGIGALEADDHELHDSDVERPRKRIRRETALIFGREVILYIDEDTGSTDIAYDAPVSPAATLRSLESDDADLPDQSKSIDTDRLPQIHNARASDSQPMLTTTLERGLGAEHSRSLPGAPRGPTHSSRPSWSSYEPLMACESQQASPSLASAWYESFKAQERNQLWHS